MEVENFVIGLNEDIFPQVALHISSLLIFLIYIIVLSFVLVLVIKIMRRSIKALDLYIEKHKYKG